MVDKYDNGVTRQSMLIKTQYIRTLSFMKSPRGIGSFNAMQMIFVKLMTLAQ